MVTSTLTKTIVIRMCDMISKETLEETPGEVIFTVDSSYNSILSKAAFCSNAVWKRYTPAFRLQREHSRPVPVGARGVLATPCRVIVGFWPS